MKVTALFALVAGLAVQALPAAKRNNGPTDTQILQYALTLEHLENKFYSDALAKFSASDFANAGCPDWVRGRLSQVASHENDHVTLLSGALGKDAVQPCTYKFPYTDVKSFISLAHIIENVGVSAYIGAAPYIQDKAYLTVAATILTTEARHQSWEASSVLLEQPWSSAYDTPLGLNMVYTIASAFITSCPSSNPTLPVKAYPALTVAGNPGDNVQFMFNDPHNRTNYAIFYSGLGTQAVQLDENDYATIPAALQGIYYVVISTTNNATAVSDSNIVAGPAILELPFAPDAKNPAFTGM